MPITEIVLAMDRELPKLKRHKKKLLGPFSHAFLKHPDLMSEVSWAESLFYESLWIGFLIQQRGFKFAIRCGEVLGSISNKTDLLIGKSNKNIPIYFWSHMKTVNFRSSKLNDCCRTDEHVRAVREMVILQTDISQFNCDQLEIFKKITQNKFFHRICDKENPFALQVMFVGFVIDICSGKLMVPNEMLRQMKPETLENYPHDPAAILTAGMLRAGVNAKAAYLDTTCHIIDTLPLWRVVSEMGDCQ